MTTKHTISLRVNDVNYSKTVESRMTLVDFLRYELGLTGTHVGCEHGVCGACSILFNGVAMRSCLMLAVQAEGADLKTIESLQGPSADQLHPIQEAFIEKHGLQCGFCTPGFIMTACDLLAHNTDPTDEEIREAIGGNLCRCTGYENIIESVKLAAVKYQAKQQGE